MLIVLRAEAAGWALLVLGAVGLLTGALIGVVRRELHRQAGLVTTTAESWLIEVLPPARVLGLLLDRVYGPSEFNAHLVTALLGGEGLATDGTDVTISEHTEIDYRLSRIDEHRYHLISEARYSFRNRVPTDTVVIFATSDHALRDSIISACRLPLFELWFVREDDETPLFAESVDRIKASVGVGVQFVDDEGKLHDIAPDHPREHLRDVGIDSWGQYLTFFRSGLAGELARRSRYLDKLRIFEVDLKALASGDVSVATIQRLTIRATVTQRIADGFCYWEAPYPCFVERMRLDTTSFDLDDETELSFHVKPFTVQSLPWSPTWTTHDPVPELPVRSWLLPGHGIALMWRPDLTPRAIPASREGVDQSLDGEAVWWRSRRHR